MTYPNLKTGVKRHRGRHDIDVLFLAGKQIADGFNFSIAKGGSAGISLITIQLADKNGNPCVEDPINQLEQKAGQMPIGENGGVAQCFNVYLSDSANGANVTAVTASGAVAAGANGAVLSIDTASKVFQVISDANGIFQLSITDTAKTGFYVCAVSPLGVVYVSRQLTSADYM